MFQRLPLVEGIRFVDDLEEVPNGRFDGVLLRFGGPGVSGEVLLEKRFDMFRCRGFDSGPVMIDGSARSSDKQLRKRPDARGA